VIPRVVERSDNVDTYPTVPNPATVDVRFSMFVAPGPRMLENEEKEPLREE
jgi:hypothetical protein